MQKWYLKTLEYDKRMKRWLFKERTTIQKDWSLTTRIVMFFVSGILGWWGTLTIWNDGNTGLVAHSVAGHTGQRFILGAIDPLTGWLAMLSCILSVFLFNEVVSFQQES